MIKEIKEIQLILKCDYNCPDNKSCELCEAEKLYNAGYRKQVWHKVADGDLPAQLKDVLCVTEDIFTKDKVITVGCITEKNLWFLENDTERHSNLEDVLAWAELPEYKE